MKHKILIPVLLVLVSFLLGSALVWTPAAAELFVSSSLLKAVMLVIPFIIVVLLPMYMLRREIKLCEKYGISQWVFNLSCFAGMALSLEAYRRITISESAMEKLLVHSERWSAPPASLEMIWLLFLAGIVWIFLSRLIFGAVVNFLSAPRK